VAIGFRGSKTFPREVAELQSLHYGRDDKGEGGASIERLVKWMDGTAGPSAPLRSGRDDTSVRKLDTAVA
jgi:hypothetical protein